MTIEVFAAHSHAAKADFKGKVAVVIDTLRATSTMITALNNGCEQVIPVPEVDEAMQMKARLGGSAVLGGERNAQKLPGFDFCNSPLEYTQSKVAGKTLVMSTSNGTMAIAKASGAKQLYMGAMINGSTVAQKLAALGQNAVILCAGTNGRLSLDDCITAGYILHQLQAQLAEPAALDDAATLCLALYDLHHADLEGCVKHAKHYGILQGLDLQADIDYCLTRDSVPVLPYYENGRILLER